VWAPCLRSRHRVLARNGRDWHTLIEFCGLIGTIIVDEDGIYDPRHPNDRLLLGMKGTIRETAGRATAPRCRPIRAGAPSPAAERMCRYRKRKREAIGLQRAGMQHVRCAKSSAI
jgi:hypothetical protein